MKLVKYGLFATIFALSSQATMALTLDEMVRYVIDNNPDIIAASKTVNQAEELRKQSFAGFLPTITASAGATNLDRDNKDAVDGESRPRTSAVTLNQTLFAGGQNFYGFRASKADELAAKATFINTSQDIIQSAVNAYVGVLTAQDVLDLQNNQVQILEQHLRMTKARFDSGEVTKTDVQQSEARLASAIASKVQAYADFVTSKEVFKNLYGKLPLDLEWPEVNFDVPIDLADVKGEVLASHPSIQAALASVDASQNELKVAKGAHLPTVTATASYSTNRDRFASDYDDTAVGVQLSLPIFEGGRTQSAVRSAVAEKEKQLQQYESVKRNVSQELVAATEYYKAYIAALRSYEVAQRSTESARDGVRKEQQVGERTTLDVLDAEQELLQAMVNVAQAKGNVVKSAYRTLAAAGVLVTHFEPVE